jgi:malate dehydrogenase (oxaloacetate-decarboxylating)
VNNITDEMKISAAIALADAVDNPSPEKIIPGPFEEGIADLIAASIK